MIFSTGHRENIDGLSGDIELIEGSVADIQLMNRALNGAEVVFHEAAIPSVPRSVENPANPYLLSRWNV
jgi:UDP-glucose 4-epimerase